MNFKTKKVVSILKKNLIVYVILWLILTIVLIAPVSYAIVNSTVDGTLVISKLTENILPSIMQFTTIGEVFGNKYIDTFKTIEFVYSAIFIFMVATSISKNLPKSQYSNIEHGSSDWCVEGEQYKILSKKSGLILAKENYLPLDKRGNLNVLIVGRIWNW